MDLRKIKKLIELVEESGICELEVRNGEEAVRIVRPMAPGADTPVAVLPQAAAAPAEKVAMDAEPAPSHALHAPMAGTFYAAPAPGAAPFVSVGSAVRVGDVLCIIESMKMMNEIRAERDGEVVAVMVENGEPIASGQALFQLR